LPVSTRKTRPQKKNIGKNKKSEGTLSKGDWVSAGKNRLGRAQGGGDKKKRNGTKVPRNDLKHAQTFLKKKRANTKKTNPPPGGLHS